MGHESGAMPCHEDESPAHDAPAGDGKDHAARSGRGAASVPDDVALAEAIAIEDELAGDEPSTEEPSTEAPAPGVPVTPEEYRRLKNQAAEMPEQS